MKIMRHIRAVQRRLTWRRFVHLPSSVRIQPPQVTLKACERLILSQERGAYLRFGDGDINLALGQKDLLQEWNSKLQHEMKEAFALAGDGIIKALPIHCHLFGYTPGMQDGMFMGDDQFAEKALLKVFEYFIGSPIYSPVALHYLALFSYDECVKFLKFLKHSNPILVGNQDIPTEVSKMLFGQTIHVKSPARSAYQEIDRIEEEVMRALSTRKGYTVISLAMGCSGRVLQKRILLRAPNRDLFLFDFGSLMDAFCGWKTRSWMGLAGVPDNYYEELLDDVAAE
jgi:hypothetical protein